MDGCQKCAGEAAHIHAFNPNKLVREITTIVSDAGEVVLFPQPLDPCFKGLVDVNVDPGVVPAGDGLPLVYYPDDCVASVAAWPCLRFEFWNSDNTPNGPTDDSRCGDCPSNGQPEFWFDLVTQTVTHVCVGGEIKPIGSAISGQTLCEGLSDLPLATPTIANMQNSEMLVKRPNGDCVWVDAEEFLNP